MNFTDFTASLTPEQRGVFTHLLHDNLAEANILQNRAHNSHVEAYWNGRFDSLQLLYCYLEPEALGNIKITQQFMDMASETPDRWRLDVDRDNKEVGTDPDEYNEINSEKDKITLQISYAQIGGTEYRCYIKVRNNTQSYILCLDHENNVGGGYWVDNTSVRTTQETAEIDWDYV